MAKNKDIDKIKKLLKIDYGWQTAKSKIIEANKETLWGPGTWTQEADLIEWKEKSPVGDIFCRITRNMEMGNLCGYVSIPENHPYYKFSNDDDVPIQTYGGLTYIGVWKGKKYIGFDCAHSDDLAPSMNSGAIGAIMKSFNHNKHKKYRDIEFVRENIHKMVQQLIAAIKS